MLNTDNPRHASLVAALTDIERFVGHGGWDQPARLFALVETDVLIAADPAIAEQLGLRGTADGAPEGGLTSVEQEDFHIHGDVGEALAQIGWPATVHGCALAIERSILPSDAEIELPDDPEAAARAVAAHPRHDDVRIICGALRTPDGPISFGVGRLRSRDELLATPDLVPGLGAALAQTLSSDAEAEA